MEFDQDKVAEFKEHPKTQWLAGQFERDLEKLAEAKELLEGEQDVEMAELAQAEVDEVTEQLQGQFDEMARIIEASKEEDAKPYGVVLEVRAGAGGDEASLFAGELAQMYQAYAALTAGRLRSSIPA